LAKAFIGTANAPYSAEGVRAARDDVNAYLDSSAGNAAIKINTHDSEWVFGTLKPFIDDLAKVTSCHCTNPEFIGVGTTAGRTEGVGQVQDAFKDLQKLRDNGQIPSEEADKAFDDLEKAVHSLGRRMADDFIAQMRTTKSNGASTFGLPTKIDLSMTDICTNIILDRRDELQNLVIGKLGMFKGGTFALRLRNNFNAGKAAAARSKATGPLLAEKNRELPAEERLSGKDLATISRATDTFLVPSPRPDADKNWCTSEAKRTELLMVIGYNISRAAAALNLGEGERLSSAAVRHATLNFALPDEKLVNSILSLSQQDYDLLLADAGKIDQENGGHELTTALGALREAAKDMQTVSAAGQKAVEEEGL
jgi:hypothetical protein